tara:strand:- start:1201 stop:1659 length:459 start_codon:yes stop_codon:yes gene_type:complete
MVFGEIVAGIALVKSSVDFIKSNIDTCKDISEIAGHIDNLLDAEKEVQKKRFNKNRLSISSVATEVLDAKLAAEELYNVSVLVDQRFGHGTWAGILAERKKRIDELKEAEKERMRIKKQQQEELIEILSIGFIVLVALGAALGAVYILWNFL